MRRLSSNANVINFSLCLLIVIWVVGWFFTMIGLEFALSVGLFDNAFFYFF